MLESTEKERKNLMRTLPCSVPSFPPLCDSVVNPVIHRRGLGDGGVAIAPSSGHACLG
jgi:hypothetical protein